MLHFKPKFGVLIVDLLANLWFVEQRLDFYFLGFVCRLARESAMVVLLESGCA